MIRTTIRTIANQRATIITTIITMIAIATIVIATIIAMTTTDQNKKR